MINLKNEIDLERQKVLLFLSFGILVFTHFADLLFAQLGFLLVFSVVFYIVYSVLKEYQQNLNEESKWIDVIEKLANIADIGMNATAIVSWIITILLVSNII